MASAEHFAGQAFHSSRWPDGFDARGKRVAVIGTGVIGASWVSLFLARGLDVLASDPAPGAEAALRATVAAHWPAMAATGLADGASPDRLGFAASPEAAVAEAQLVQENGPERLDLKRDLFRRLDEAAPAAAILATSSSTITVSEFQGACAHHPERVVLGHPFNPPHLIPLVEVAGGRATSPETVARAMAFYRAIGKHLVAAGVASVADIDAAIAHGPGLRWALLGPFLNLHLSGGEGGIGALFDKPLWQATESMWRDLGTVSVDPGLGRRVVDGVTEELAARNPDAMVRQRDAALLDLIRLKARAKDLP
jgi:3-hydroxyacyl-CoA dehydrogenase